MREVDRKRRDYVCSRLTAMGLPFPEPEGAFYVFPSIAEFGIGSEEFCLRLIQEGKVAAVPGSCFGADGYIRLSYCYSEAELKRGLDRLEDFVTKLREKD
jgi:aminotransferase